MLETDILQFKLTGLDGVEKTYTLRPIMRREANWVFHNFVKTALKATTKGIDGILSVLETHGTNEDEELLQSISSIGEAIDAIEFDTVYKVADILFAGGMVASCTTDPIHNGSCTLEFAELPKSGKRRMGDNGEDYFRDHPDELYVAVFKAINANWPKVFTRAREKLKGLGALIKTVSRAPNESDGE
jgi:hypothetical protein